MSIDPELLLSWAESRFDDIAIKGNEIKVNSIFCDDHKRHLCINPTGGKKNIENGVFHCWKTGRGGSCVSLVMLVDKCSYDQAMEVLGGADISLARLEAKINEMFDPKPVVQEEKILPNTLKLPPFTELINNIENDDFYRCQAEVYLIKRCLPTDNLMICTNGDFINRIIIPYYDKNGKLIYFNSRYIGKKENILRYKGPDKNTGVGKEDVLFSPEWPKDGSPIYLTEGEFDALSIYHSGRKRGESVYSAAFGGKNLSDKQIEMIKNYQPILCLDTDKAGKEGLITMGNKLTSLGFTPSYVRVPEKYKDWNKMLQEVGEGVLLYYLLNNKKPLNDEAMMRFSL